MDGFGEETEVARAVAEVVRVGGPTVAGDAGRVRAMVNDLLGDSGWAHRAEVDAVVAAAELGVADDLRAGLDDAGAMARLRSRGIDEQVGRSALAAWRYGLGSPEPDGTEPVATEAVMTEPVVTEPDETERAPGDPGRRSPVLVAAVLLGLVVAVIVAAGFWSADDGGGATATRSTSSSVASTTSAATTTSRSRTGTTAPPALDAWIKGPVELYVGCDVEFEMEANLELVYIDWPYGENWDGQLKATFVWNEPAVTNLAVPVATADGQQDEVWKTVTAVAWTGAGDPPC